MIVDFIRKLFAGMPTPVTTLLGTLAAATFGAIGNSLLNISRGEPWDSHVFLLALAGALAKVILDALGSAFMPKQAEPLPTLPPKA